MASQIAVGSELAFLGSLQFPHGMYKILSFSFIDVRHHELGFFLHLFIIYLSSVCLTYTNMLRTIPHFK